MKPRSAPRFGSSVPLPSAPTGPDGGGPPDRKLPVTPSSIPEARSDVPSSAPQTTTVGIVEDDSGLRHTLDRLLNLSKGFRCVCSCATAEEALKSVPRTLPDVVLMDIHLPNRSGIECTALLRQQVPGLQIIILTVYDDASTLFKALRAGACGYLLKRARPEEILEAIHEAQRGGAPMSSEIARQVVAAFEEPTPVAGPDDTLSRREHEILDHLLRGYANKEIATRLSISVFTVKNHLRHIYEKLHVRSRTEVVLRFKESRGDSDARPRRI